MQELLDSIKNTISFINHQNKNTIHIGYGIDNNCARCTGTSIASFCINNSHRNFTFHILSSGISQNNIQKFHDLSLQYNTNIIIYEIDTTYLESINLPTKTGLPLPTYFRFILPLILKQHQKFYYIDSDIICLKNADDLFNIQLNNNIIGAVPEYDSRIRTWCISLNLDNHIYFNAGMLIVDIAKWNQFNIFEKLISHVNHQPEKFPFLDQDALNLILDKKIQYVSSKYNYFNWVYYKKAPENLSLNDIILIHFGSYPKPWGIAWPSSKYYNKFNANLYLNYEKQTPWATEPLNPPKYYKEMKRYAKYLLKNNQISNSLFWYYKYSITKIQYLLKK